MALNDILEKIKEETQKRIDQIQEQTNLKIRQLEDDYGKKITAETEKILDRAKKEAAKKTKQAQIKISLETKNLILAQKQKILDNLWQSVLNDLAKLDDEQYLDLITDFLAKCPKEKGIIIPAKGREKITQEAIKRNKRDYSLSKKTLNVSGGFIYHSETIEINATFEELIKEMKESMNIELTKILFS